MAYHEKFNTTFKEIVLYYQNILDEKEFNIDISDLQYRCWNCGEIKKVFRCHIVPSSRGGKDEPSNYVLLCKKCHEQAPNSSNPEIMWDWIKSNKKNCNDMYLGNLICDEFQRVYSKNLLDEIYYRFHDKENELIQQFNKNIKDFSTHLGDGGFNISSWVGLWKIILDNYDKNNLH